AVPRLPRASTRAGMPRNARQAPEEEKGSNPMRSMMVLLAVRSLAATVVAQAPKEQAEPPNLYQVEKIALGTGVESRELVGDATEFDVSVGRIYCWTRIISQNVPTTIKHVWYADEQPVAEGPLNLK